MSKKELYEKLEMSQQGFIDMIERESMKVKTLEKLSEIFQVPISSWFQTGEADYQKNLMEETGPLYILSKQLDVKDKQIDFLQNYIIRKDKKKSNPEK